MYRYVLSSALCAFVVASVCFGQAPDLTKMDIVERSTPDGPVAIVLGTPIMKEEFLARYKSELLEYMSISGDRNPSDETRVRIAIQCLTHLAEREILYQEAVKRNLTASADEVNKALDAYIKEMQDEAVRVGRPKPSAEEVVRLRGDTLETYREKTRKNIMLGKVKKLIAEEMKIKVTDEEIRKFYEDNASLFVRPSRVRLQQIYKQPKPNAKSATEQAWADARKEIERALARVKAGESFEAVARSMSESPDKDKGGDMGWVPLEIVPPALAQILPNMKPGDLSEPIKSPFGWHIFKLLDKEEAQKITLDEAKERIRMLLMDQKLDEALYEFCKPYLNDPEKVKFFISLQHILVAVPQLEDELLGRDKPASTSQPSKNKKK